MVCFGIILQQCNQLPQDYLRLGCQLKYSNQTSITFMDGYVQKQVDLSQDGVTLKPEDISRLAKLYQDVLGSDYIGQVVKGPAISRSRRHYTVSVKPCGHPLSCAPSSTPQLKAAVRCWIMGLMKLHESGHGHGDIRWPNLIRVKDDHFCVIDLEGSVRLGSSPTLNPCPKSWRNGEALESGVYTVQSDFWQVGKLLDDTDLRDDADGRELCQRILDRTLSGANILLHKWFKP